VVVVVFGAWLVTDWWGGGVSGVLESWWVFDKVGAWGGGG